MDIRVGDILEMKKPHPCGTKESKQFLVLRIGMDFRIRCQGCGHEVMLPRSEVPSVSEAEGFLFLCHFQICSFIVNN